MTDFDYLTANTWIFISAKIEIRIFDRVVSELAITSL